MAFWALGWDLQALVPGRKHQPAGDATRGLDEELPALAPERAGNSFNVVQEVLFVAIFKNFKETFQIQCTAGLFEKAENVLSPRFRDVFVFIGYGPFNGQCRGMVQFKSYQEDPCGNCGDIKLLATDIGDT
jgi:hypothetical protein